MRFFLWQVDQKYKKEETSIKDLSEMCCEDGKWMELAKDSI